MTLIWSPPITLIFPHLTVLSPATYGVLFICEEILKVNSNACSFKLIWQHRVNLRLPTFVTRNTRIPYTVVVFDFLILFSTWQTYRSTPSKFWCFYFINYLTILQINIWRTNYKVFNNIICIEYFVNDFKRHFLHFLPRQHIIVLYPYVCGLQ